MVNEDPLSLDDSLNYYHLHENFRSKSLRVARLRAHTMAKKLAIEQRTRYDPTSKESNRPVFFLMSDTPGHDGNGGLVGWGDLLRVSEKTKTTIKGNVACRPAHEGGCKVQQNHEVKNMIQTMCTGQWSRHSSSPGCGERRVLKVALTSHSTTSVNSNSDNKARSGFKSTSRLSLPLRRKAPMTVRAEERWRHVARPRGNGGGYIGVEDLF